MSLDFNSFINLDIIKESTILTDKKFTESLSIESISVIELPVENFVRKNELVLSTCIGCQADIDVFKSFVRDIHLSGASALMIASGRYVQKIPAAIIDYANELNFTIIEIPWNIKFSNIIEATLIKINNIRQANVKYFESLQKKLLTSFLNGFTLFEAAEIIYNELGNQVVIASTSGRIKGRSSESDEFLKILEPPLSVLESGKNLDLLSNFDFEDIYTVYKISSKNIVYGYLYLKTITDESKTDYVSENRTLVVRHIASAISLWFDREQTIFETEMHHKDKFVWNLIRTEDNKIDDLIIQAESLGYNLSIPYICIVGVLNDPEASYNLKRSEYSSFEQWEFDTIKNIKREIIRAARAINQEIMTTLQNDLIIIFLEIKDDNNILDVSHNYLDIVERRIKPLYPKLILSWGISENIVYSPYFNKGYIDAKISLEIASKEKKPGYRNIYHNPSIYRLLSLIYEHKDTHDITMNIIGKLVEYDVENGLNLIDTFKTYMSNKGNVSQTARNLHLHRQSLLYRLKRIEEITCLSLDNADDMFLLELCVRLWDKQNHIVN